MPTLIGSIFAGHRAPVSGRICAMDTEWILFVYPLALIGYLMLAARWQPKASPAKSRFPTER